MFLWWMYTCVRQIERWYPALCKEKINPTAIVVPLCFFSLRVVCVRESAGGRERETHPQYEVGVSVMGKWDTIAHAQPWTVCSLLPTAAKPHTHTHTNTDTCSFFTFMLSTAVDCSMCLLQGHTHSRKRSLYLRLYGHLYYVRHKSYQFTDFKCKFAKVMQLKVKTNCNPL